MTADSTVVPSPEEQPNIFTLLASLDPTKLEWQDKGLCAQTDPEAFFPEKGGSTREAKRICVSCEVKQECLEYALELDERFGIWGGLSERERRRLKRKNNAEQDVQEVDQSTQPMVPIERQPAMKDEARFPMVRAFLWKRQGEPFIVYGGSRGRLPHDLAVAAKIHDVQELRRVLRKMGRQEEDTVVSEDPDGTLWVELKKIDTPQTPRTPGPVVVRMVDVAPVQPEDKPKVVETVVEEMVIEQTLEPTEFVEMGLPEGYESPEPRGYCLLVPTDERRAVILDWLAGQANNRVRGKSISPQVAELLGVSQGAASSVIHALAADGLIGRQLRGKQTIVTWLRQAGWDWLQAYSLGEASEPAVVAEELVVEEPIAEATVVEETAVEPVVADVENEATDEVQDEHVNPAETADVPVDEEAEHSLMPTPEPNTLQIGAEFTLDIHSLSKCYAILGMRGSGKTSTGVVMAEEMIAQGWPVAIIDPQGVWYGLRSGRDGNSPGLPVIILGGPHGDVPLDAGDGRLAASIMEQGGQSIILDISELDDDDEMQSFITDFFTAIYFRRNRIPLHIIVDEADEVAPQSNFSKDLIKAATRIAKRGRTRGIGSTWISQRPQEVNKKVLTQVEALVAMRLKHKLDIQAIDEWIGKHADASLSGEMKASLPSLKTGTGWWWSPDWLGDMSLVQMRQRWTFDTSGTPLPGQFAPEPEVMADIDLSVLPEAFLWRMEQESDKPSDEAYEEALEQIRALAPEATADVEPDVVDTVEADQEPGITSPAPAVIQLQTPEEVAELIRLRAENSALTFTTADAIRQRNEAYADLEALHAEYRLNLVELQDEITLLRNQAAVQTTESQARIRALLEQVQAREIEVTVLEARLVRHGLELNVRHLQSVQADGETA